MLSILNRCSLFAQTVYGAQGHAINTEKRASNGKDYVRCGMRHRKSLCLEFDMLLNYCSAPLADTGATYVSATCFLF